MSCDRTVYATIDPGYIQWRSCKFDWKLFWRLFNSHTHRTAYYYIAIWFFNSVLFSIADTQKNIMSRFIQSTSWPYRTKNYRNPLTIGCKYYPYNRMHARTRRCLLYMERSFFKSYWTMLVSQHLYLRAVYFIFGLYVLTFSCFWFTVDVCCVCALFFSLLFTVPFYFYHIQI